MAGIVNMDRELSTPKDYTPPQELYETLIEKVLALDVPAHPPLYQTSGTGQGRSLHHPGRAVLRRLQSCHRADPA